MACNSQHLGVVSNMSMSFDLCRLSDKVTPKSIYLKKNIPGLMLNGHKYCQQYAIFYIYQCPFCPSIWVDCKYLIACKSVKTDLRNDRNLCLKPFKCYILAVLFSF